VKRGRAVTGAWRARTRVVKSGKAATASDMGYQGGVPRTQAIGAVSDSGGAPRARDAASKYPRSACPDSAAHGSQPGCGAGRQCH
jgi:hypothetical protein